MMGSSSCIPSVPQRLIRRPTKSLAILELVFLSKAVKSRTAQCLTTEPLVDARDFADLNVYDAELKSRVSSRLLYHFSVSGINEVFFNNPNNQPPEFQAPSTANVEQNLYETGGISSSRTASTDHYRQDPRLSG
ncbi:hypothetical protein YC2023_076675 [Brassica napus]